MKILISLLLLAGLGIELPATPSAWGAEYASTTPEETISTATLDRLFTQAVDCCWATTTEVLWEEYNDATLNVSQIGTNTYRLERQVDGGLTVISLEDLL